MGWYFIFFFISGFCAILYELIWLRLCMAQFGVTTAMVSIVLSVFMAGMGLGSWASGAWVRRHARGVRFPVLRLYAVIELMIGASGILVPVELQLGHNILSRFGSGSSAEFYLVSGILVGLTIIPWCTLMGATIPVGMLAIERTFNRESTRSFGYLYMANVAGACAGTALPLLLIELFGFKATLKIGCACNVLIAALALAVSKAARWDRPVGELQQPSAEVTPSVNLGRSPLALLFTTGLTSMGMEVVWIRQFAPYRGTVVYAFASILLVYLIATFIGSCIYRRWSERETQENPALWIALSLSALFPLVAASPDLDLMWQIRLPLAIAPFTGLLGFITPMLIDRWARGNPAKAGRAYAVNVLGCILGPLLAGFVMLPWISERWALLLLSLPWLFVAVRSMRLAASQPGLMPRAAAYVLLPVTAAMFLLSKDFESQYGNGGLVRRDSTATVIAAGSGMKKVLLVNGFGITVLAPVTKMMAHLPLAFLGRTPDNALVICFGMGTTFRSLRSWAIPVTAVELVPSVPRLFGYFHSDGPEILSSPLSHLVIDDGRRYLERTEEQYDVITIDPPPPVAAAGSSLLYSENFYSVIRRHLHSDGILQQWLPHTEPATTASVALALRRSFPYVRVFEYRGWGFQFLASKRPLPHPTANALAERLPSRAVDDLLEWDQGSSAEDQFAWLLRNEQSIDHLVAASPATPPLSDDRPINEYYEVREKLPWFKQYP